MLFQGTSGGVNTPSQSGEPRRTSSSALACSVACVRFSSLLARPLDLIQFPKKELPACSKYKELAADVPYRIFLLLFLSTTTSTISRSICDATQPSPAADFETRGQLPTSRSGPPAHLGSLPPLQLTQDPSFAIDQSTSHESFPKPTRWMLRKPRPLMAPSSTLAVARCTAM